MYMYFAHAYKKGPGVTYMYISDVRLQWGPLKSLDLVHYKGLYVLYPYKAIGHPYLSLETLHYFTFLSTY